MNINAPLSIRRRMGLEIFRRLENERTEEHQLKQLFWECTLRCNFCLLYTSPSPRDKRQSRMPSSA